MESFEEFCEKIKNEKFICEKCDKEATIAVGPRLPNGEPSSQSFFYCEDHSWDYPFYGVCHLPTKEKFFIYAEMDELMKRK